MNPINHLNLQNPERYYSTQSTKIKELPNDLLTTIFDFLQLKEFAPLNILNKKFNKNISIIVNQKGWLTRKFKETLHIKFQNDSRLQLIRRYKTKLIFKNQISIITGINVPSNKNKTKLDDKIITLPSNAWPSTCQEANELVKKIFSSFIGSNTCEKLDRSRKDPNSSILAILESALKFSSKEEVTDILHKSFLFLEIACWNTRFWSVCYRDSPFTDFGLTKKIFNFAMQSKNPNINKTEILCVSLSKNAELIDEAYRIAYQIFESNYNDELLVQCIKINPKLALEVFERYKNKGKIRDNEKVTEKPILNLLAACVRACPEELSKEGFEIAKKKFGKSKKLELEALELLAACIKVDPKNGQEGLELVRSRGHAFIIEVLLAWGWGDPIHACPAIYEYLEKSINEINNFTKKSVENLIVLCVVNNSCIPNLFERTVQLLIQIEFDSSNILKSLLRIIPISPLDHNKFDLLFKLTDFFSSPPQKCKVSDVVSLFCEANLVLAKETIKNIKNLGNENVQATIFLSLLKNYPTLAQLILTEIEQLVERRQITNRKLIQDLLKGCVLADSELSPGILKYIQGWSNRDKNVVLKASNTSKKRKLKKEVENNKKVKGNEPDIVK